MIRSLKIDLLEARRDDIEAQKELRKQKAENDAINEPLIQANEEVKALEIKKEKHDEIKRQLIECQQQIVVKESQFKEQEWEYEVKL